MTFDVAIRCPRTGKLVPTGIETDQETFETLPNVRATLGRCPACGENHAWTPSIAILVRAPAEAAE
jgi:hypothetical protein